MKHQTARLYHDFLGNRAVIITAHHMREYKNITEASSKRLLELEKAHCTFHGFAGHLGKSHENEEFYIYRS